MPWLSGYNGPDIIRVLVSGETKITAKLLFGRIAIPWVGALSDTVGLLNTEKSGVSVSGLKQNQKHHQPGKI